MTTITEYRQTVASKEWHAPAHGFDPIWIPDMLFDWQRAVLRWAMDVDPAGI